MAWQPSNNTMFSDNRLNYKKLLRSEHLFKSLISHPRIGFCAVSGNRFVFVNQRLADMLGYECVTTLSQLKPLEVFPPGEQQEVCNCPTHPLPNKTSERHTIRRMRKHDGSFIELEVFDTASSLDGEAITLSLVFEINGKTSHDALTLQQSNYDFLTKLPNRQKLTRALADVLAQSREYAKQFAVIFLDLDHFKEINDQFGHAMGDCLLQQVATRLQKNVRAGEMVGRMGGDEFMVIMPNINSRDNVERLCQRFIASFEEPFILDGEHVYISASLGLTLFPNDALDVTDILKRADIAMYTAKSKGRNQFRWFHSQMAQKQTIQRRLGQEMLDGLKQHQFRLYYQPIINLNDGSIRKAEALIRWQHPERGLLGPLEFIPYAEHSSIIESLGNWVFHEATQQARYWREKYCSDFQISINVSPNQFTKQNAQLNQWPQLLQQEDVGKMYSVIIEITEGLLMDSTGTVQQQLRHLRTGGMQIALDDFGTGYSSLAYLKKFDIDYIKIDRSFVSNLGPNTDDRALCDAIIAMAHRLGLKVIAEGIETEGQHALLQEGACDYGQGYLFGHPMPAEQFAEVLAANHGKEGRNKTH